MLQPPGSVIELCHVVDDMDKAIQHWTTIMGAGPFYVGAMPFEKGHRYRGEPAVLALKVAFGFTGGLLIEIEIGREHVCNPVPNAPLVCRILLDNTNPTRSH